ncbi:DeoR/GlpR transcriptional regulator [Salinibacterium sp. NYA9b]
MKLNRRRSELLQALEERGSVSVVDAAERFHVSPMTVRRDLLELEKAGLARRVHGGAVIGRGRSFEPPYLVRANEASEAKSRIARTAAALIAESDSIAIDTGSTALGVARMLTGRRNITVVTPSMRAAQALSENPELRVVLTGGMLRTGEGSLTGDFATRAFQDLSVDRLILAAAGIDASFGLSDYNWDDVLVKQSMVGSAKEVIVVADSSKFGRVAFARIAGLDIIDKLVTDVAPTGELAEQLRLSGVKVIIAEAAVLATEAGSAT